MAILQEKKNKDFWEKTGPFSKGSVSKRWSLDTEIFRAHVSWQGLARDGFVAEVNKHLRLESLGDMP